MSTESLFNNRYLERIVISRTPAYRSEETANRDYLVRIQIVGINLVICIVFIDLIYRDTHCFTNNGLL